MTPLRLHCPNTLTRGGMWSQRIPWQQKPGYYRIPPPGSLPLGITMDANQRLWFTGIDKISMLSPGRS